MTYAGNFEADFADEIGKYIPNLKVFAKSLCRNATEAEDLLQDSLLRAWAARRLFQPDTNLKAWLYVIIRNQFYSTRRRQGRQQTLAAALAAVEMVDAADPSVRFELEDVRRALSLLPEDQRQAVLLVGASGLSYEEAAAAAGCPIGTIKSRVNRARARLAYLVTDGRYRREFDLRRDQGADGNRGSAAGVVRTSGLKDAGAKPTGPKESAAMDKTLDQTTSEMSDLPDKHTSILADKVKGTTVYNAAGEKIGHIDDLSIDKVSGHITAAILSLGGFLGLGQKYHPIPWNVLHYDVSKNGYVAPLDRDQLMKAPSYDKHELGDTGEGRREEVYTYYAPFGAKPYW